MDYVTTKMNLRDINSDGTLGLFLSVLVTNMPLIFFHNYWTNLLLHTRVVKLTLMFIHIR